MAGIANTFTVAVPVNLGGQVANGGVIDVIDHIPALETFVLNGPTLVAPVIRAVLVQLERLISKLPTKAPVDIIVKGAVAGLQ